MSLDTQTINGREVTAFACYFNNIPKDMIKYQRQVFDKFGMHLNQELETINHAHYLDTVMRKIDADIYVFFDIDAIPLKAGIYEYIVDKVKDNNSIIGVEEAPNHVDYRSVYAGPSCFGITKPAYEKMGNPTFAGKAGRCDVAGELTFAAKANDVNIHLFYIKSSYDNIWRCGENKRFGHGTTYEDWVYHQFESPTMLYQIQFISKCKHVLAKP